MATALAATLEEKKLLLCFCLRDGKPCPNGSGCAYSHKKNVIDKAKKAKEETQAKKGNIKWKCNVKGKGKDKDKGQGKGNICPYFNNKSCNHGRACKMLNEAPVMAARDDQTEATSASKAKAAAALKTAAANPSKP